MASSLSSVTNRETPLFSRPRAGIQFLFGGSGRSRWLSRHWIGQNVRGVTPTMVTAAAALGLSVECTVIVEPIMPESAPNRRTHSS